MLSPDIPSHAKYPRFGAGPLLEHGSAAYDLQEDCLDEVFDVCARHPMGQVLSHGPPKPSKQLRQSCGIASVAGKEDFFVGDMTQVRRV
jgi:hypothetical protein